MALRSLNRVKRAALNYRSWVGLYRGLSVYNNPVRELRNYILNGGVYPYDCRLNTRKGPRIVTLESIHDLKVVHEIFCYEVYKVEIESLGTVVDIGANIGIASLYFICQYDAKVLYLFEPNPANKFRLKEVLRGFEDRYIFNESAIGISDRKASFGIDPYGQYGGLMKRIGDGCDSNTHQITKEINVSVQDVNRVLSQVIEKHGVIDLVKIDTEGSEVFIVQAIHKRFFPMIYSLVFDGSFPVRLLTWLFFPFKVKATVAHSATFIELPVISNRR